MHTQVAFALALEGRAKAFAVVRTANTLVSRFGGPDLGRVDAICRD